MSNPMISYSMNFEDVILMRALGHLEKGVYVDVGAAFPLAESNTAAFYQKGWRGICIEPIQNFNAQWSQYRPEDILINAVAGNRVGETTFYHFGSATQISTASPATLNHWREHNYQPDQEYTVPVYTLNALLEKHLNGTEIHLLAIDVEGSEQQVLEGLNLARYRPWVVLIEATVPGTHVPSYSDWEAYLLDADYLMVYQDGTNRFYLAKEHEALRPFFINPPGIRDNFISYREQQLIEKNDFLNKQVRALEARLTQTWWGKIQDCVKRFLNINK